MDRRNFYLELAIKQELIDGHKELLSLDIQKDKELENLFIFIIEENPLLKDILKNIIKETENDTSQESLAIHNNAKLILSQVPNNEFSLHKQTQISINDIELRQHSKLNQYLLPQSFDSYDPLCNTIAKNYKLRYIQNNPILHEYFDGFLFTINQGYSISMTLHSNKLSIDKFSEFDMLILLAPVIAQSSIISLEKLIMKPLIVKRATNICNFSGSIVDFESLIQDIVLDIVIKKKSSLENINPDICSTDWLIKLKNTFQEIDKKIYGTRYETPMQKLGYKDACYLLDYIGSGKIYKGEMPIKISLKEKALRLKNALESIIDGDLDSLNKDNTPTEKLKYKFFCNIFTVKEFLFKNKILNHPQIIENAIKQSCYKMNSFLDLSSRISEDLVDEIIETADNDIELAGQMLICAIISL